MSFSSATRGRGWATTSATDLLASSRATRFVRFATDLINPAAREAYFIHRMIPANFADCAIDAANKSMTCTVK